MRRVWLVAGCAAMLLLAACGESKSMGGRWANQSPWQPERVCEKAYEAGEGNADGSDRASWIADCMAEQKAAGR